MTQLTDLPKILFCDEDLARANSLAKYFDGFGFLCRAVNHSDAAKATCKNWVPDLIITDLMFSGLNAFAFISWLKKSDIRPRPRVIVTSNHNSRENVEKAFRLGAIDYLVQPIDKDNLLGRLLFHSQKITKIPQVIGQDSRKKHSATPFASHSTGTYDDAFIAIDEILSEATAEGNLVERLHKIVDLTNSFVGGVRTNIVRYKDQTKGIVIASNDDKDVFGLEIDLSKYPEVLTAVNTRSAMIIENLDSSGPFSSILKHLKNLRFNALIVCPIFYKSKVFGTLTLRMQETSELPESTVHFGQIVAKTLSLALTSQDSLGLGNTENKNAS